MNVHESRHLPKLKQMQLGSFYTPQQLVDKVHEFISPYLKHQEKDVIVFDSAGGCGAFLQNLRDSDYRIADCDSVAYAFLREKYDVSKVFHTNSLAEVRRNKYSIPSAAFLVMIGNPPYNDITSEYRHGEKGNNVCDADLFDRDLGISFLRSYDKLQADVVCILHPLSYLIKRANFDRLSNFRNHYRLVKAEIFSSALFSGTGAFKFPILVALYERYPGGMSFNYILNFSFKVLNSEKRFVLSDYQTTDGYIHKYPPRTNSDKKSLIGLYYYTFRDINSLKRSQAFLSRKHANGIVVTVENFYKYCYLYSMKNLFNPENLWMYGNLSPLVDKVDLELHKKLYVKYALWTDRVLRQLNKETVRKIKNYYEIEFDSNTRMYELERAILRRFDRLLNSLSDKKEVSNVS